MKKLKNVNGLSLTKDTLKLLDSPERDAMREVAGGAVSNRYHSGQICC